MNANSVSSRCRQQPWLTATLVATVVFPLFTWSYTAIAQPPNPRETTHSNKAIPPQTPLFYCESVLNPSGEQTTTTVVWVPERQGNVRLIGWEPEYFGHAIDPKAQCQTTTQALQTKFDAGQLNYLTTGYLNGYPVVCGVASQAETCTEDTLLFTLKPNDYPDEVLQTLMEILGGEPSELLLQSSEGQIYISVKEALKQGAIGNRDLPPTATAGGDATPSAPPVTIAPL
jgi:hypothetical protein